MAGPNGGITVVCVQQPEPMSESEPPPYAAGEEATADPRKRRKLRLWVAMAAGVLGILCLGGVGVAVLLYDEETKIERTAPDAVVDRYLRAYLVDRDENQQQLFACKSGGDFAQLEAYRKDIESRESQFSIRIQVSWEDLRVATSGTRGTVDADLTRAIQDSEQVTDSWRFTVVDEDGWRVCGAARTS